MSITEARYDDLCYGPCAIGDEEMLSYQIVAPDEVSPTWGVRVVDATRSREGVLYGFADDEAASTWIRLHADAYRLTGFPYLRMAKVMYQFSAATGRKLPPGEVERAAERLFGDIGEAVTV